MTDALVQHIPIRRLEARRDFSWKSLADVWRFRELLYFLVWRDIKVRYKQTALGAGWAIIQPVLAMIVFTVFFGRLAKMPSDGVPYPLFSLAALIPWTYFATALSNGSQSLIGQQHVISKVYFPRLLVPIAGAVAPLVDGAIALATILPMMLAYHVMPSAAVAALPLFALLAIVSASAGALWLSALTVRYRDIRYVLPFVVQIWMFATPVVYPASVVPTRWRTLYGLNPLVGVIEGFRWALVGGPPPGPSIFVSAVVVIIALLGGVVYFRRIEGTLVDIL